jgi:hypothetical protein
MVVLPADLKEGPKVVVHKDKKNLSYSIPAIKMSGIFFKSKVKSQKLKVAAFSLLSFNF